MRDYVIMIHVKSDNPRMVDGMMMHLAEAAYDYNYDESEFVKLGDTHIIPDATISAEDIAKEKAWGNELQEFIDAGINPSPLPNDFPSV